MVTTIHDDHNPSSSRWLSANPSVQEEADDPLLRSGELLTDALFAMAVFEAKENSVSEISDGAFSETCCLRLLPNW